MMMGVAAIAAYVSGPGLGAQIFQGLSQLGGANATERVVVATILIIAFATDYMKQGMELVEATMQAVRDRLRPILMTSLAFGMGVLPLATASGAGSGAQRAIGTGVLGGMVVGVALGIFFIPLFFVVVQKVFGVRKAAGENP